MLHVCFSENAHAFLRICLGETNIVWTNDDLSIGRLAHDVGQSFEEHRQMQMECFVDDSFTMSPTLYDGVRKAIQLNNEVTIWFSDVPFEYNAMLYTVSQLDSRHIARLVNISHVKELKQLGMVSVSSIGVCEKLPEVWRFSLLTQGEKTKYSRLWQGLCAQNGMLRTWINGGFRTVPDDYFDDVIAKCLGNEIMKIVDLASKVDVEMNNVVNVYYIFYRIKKFISTSEFIITEKADGDEWQNKITATQ